MRPGGAPKCESSGWPGNRRNQPKRPGLYTKSHRPVTDDPPSPTPSRILDPPERQRSLSGLLRLPCDMSLAWLRERCKLLSKDKLGSTTPTELVPPRRTAGGSAAGASLSAAAAGSATVIQAATWAKPAFSRRKAFAGCSPVYGRNLYTNGTYSMTLPREDGSLRTTSVSPSQSCCRTSAMLEYGTRVCPPLASTHSPS